ncbi:hypothetical protein CKM354_000986000 [Cercospora kikuchii]|uniref:Zn(2)-C6 fungal-type domain-containing protein n=1 Tax=Cercospora kikuchii TaxID=84275 RepID=A0A9P3CSH6_9PEZI|nr:uncharacterized protein CKM354_000986000 [Cercospora kikuchii]GIZ46747.1 hypothetical protein CKM354_000986000 [Cercospora kikuchii]
MDTSTSVSTDAAAAAAKRKRSPSTGSVSAPVAKAAKTSSQLSINYLARQSHDDLPLINKDDTLPNLLHLLGAYSNILDRHESLASNLGARPLGPILIKRFERCFDAPPKIVASHHKNATGDPAETSHTITWLEVIEFARAHPSQFTLSTFSEGRRVCQFYYPQKQLRVQISEEDFLFINSGRCQELIPPLPIWEDEEKEVGTCDVLETKLKELTNVADMVAARTRQLSHRLKGRRAAILERRAEGGSGTPAKATAPQTTTAPPSSSGSGFVAVNATPANGKPVAETVEPMLGSNAAIRTELLRHFESLPHNQNAPKLHARHQSTTVDPQQTPKTLDFSGTLPNDGITSNTSSLSPVPTNALGESLPYASDSNRASSTTYTHRPSLSTGNPYSSSHTPLKHNFSRPLPPALESSQPFRPLCQAHMDSLPRGTRVMPPCDRCRRLRMDCVKNLTSCAGCTRKHARCHWRDVSREELGALDHLMDSSYPGFAGSPTNGAHPSNGYANGTSDNGDSDDDDSNPLEDLEALDEKEEQENQIREDEEGLRNAKELARQGFEDSMRDGQQQQPISNEPGEPNRGPGGTLPGHVQTANVGIAQTAEEPQPVGNLATPPNSAQVQERPLDLPFQPHGNQQREMLLHKESAPMDRPPSTDTATTNGGFRPVNETMNNGSTITSGGTGWRAI